MEDEKMEITPEMANSFEDDVKELSEIEEKEEESNE